MLEKLVAVCGASRQSLKSSLVIVYDSKGVGALKSLFSATKCKIIIEIKHYILTDDFKLVKKRPKNNNKDKWWITTK